MNRLRELVDKIVEKNLIRKAGANELLEQYKGRTNGSLELMQELLRTDPGRKDVLGQIWSNITSLSYVDLDKITFDPEIVGLLPEQFAKQHGMICLYRFGEIVTVAMADPANYKAINAAQKQINSGVSPVFAFPDDIKDALEVEYQSVNDLEEKYSNAAMKLFSSGEEKTMEQLKLLAEREETIEFTWSLLLLGVKDSASDIHLEPDEECVRVRFRVDGALHERCTFPLSLHELLVMRLKVLAELDITERRRPQDGRVSLPLAKRPVDIRLSCVPTIYGEKIVLRILGQNRFKGVPELHDLGLTQSAIQNIRRAAKRPNGIIFVTGPTGSGKTTTLFSLLKEVNTPDKNIVTIEDPVEYRLKGVNQVQVNRSVDFSFPNALRSFLRQDPDVILVGEIRDLETAKMAAQSALTGHLVLATMHTNNALQAVTRLVEIGVQPYLVAPSILGVVAQRLVRKLCVHCREAYTPSAKTLDRLFDYNEDASPTFYRARGCAACVGGYKGRMALQEVLIIDDEMRRLVAKEAAFIEMRDLAFKQGFRPMHYDGVKKVLRGLTTIEEVERVVAQGEL